MAGSNLREETHYATVQILSATSAGGGPLGGLDRRRINELRDHQIYRPGSHLDVVAS